jgi:Reverse transcriptase (RNA-dependent DNA polymerase)
MPDIFSSIISSENIKNAYLDLAKKFDTTAKSSSYFGIEGALLNDHNYTSEELLAVVTQEMEALTPITPAISHSIPKKNGGHRDIYVYSIRERVKAQAMYRVLEPILDEALAPYIYSYRASRPSYFAARSVVRRYKRFFGKNYILTADISDFSGSIDQDILLQKLQPFEFDPKTFQLIELFVKSSRIEEGKVIQPNVGLMTGTPLYGMLSNLYMSEFDVWAGKYAAFYRRIGDDMVAMDTHKEKIDLISERLNSTVASHKINLNLKKVFISDDSNPFIFLGYQFKDGKISYDPKSLSKILLKWQVELNRYPGSSVKRKLHHLKRLISSKRSNLEHEFNQLVKQKILVDDLNDVKNFSEKFYQMLTAYFYGRYTPELRRELTLLCEDAEIESFFSHYRKIHYPDSYAK